MLKKVTFFFCYTFTSTIILFIIVNSICSFLINTENKDQKNALTFLSFIYFNAYSSGEKANAHDSLYIREAVSDFVEFTQSESGEYQYYPGIEFNTRSFASKHLNVKKATNDLSHRISFIDTTFDKSNGKHYAIYCFGGSTTFGTIVSDLHTWPAYLHQVLKQQNNHITCIVENYGTSGYTPTQETEKFLHLLKLGHRPSIAIFMDGINTGPRFDGSEFSRGIEQRFNQNPDAPVGFLKYIIRLPVFRYLRQEFRLTNFMEGDMKETYPFEADSGCNQLIVNRFIENARIRKAIGKLYGVEVVNLLQPSTYVQYNEEWLLPKHKESITAEQKRNFQYLYQTLRTQDSLFVDLSGLFLLYNKPAVVDGLHYSPGFNHFLAKNLLPYIRFEELNIFRMDTAAATGVSF